MTWLVILLIAGGIAAWILVALYNRLVRLRNGTANALAQIDVQLKRRYELIPNLVDVARKYLQHESETLQAVIAARNQADGLRQQWQGGHGASAETAQALQSADRSVQNGLGRLFALAESYPDLKADAALRDLSDELAHTENRVSFSRQAYNDAVLAFNTASQSFPANIVALLFGFQPLVMLQSTASEEERAAVRVQMDAR